MDKQDRRELGALKQKKVFEDGEYEAYRSWLLFYQSIKSQWNRADGSL